MNNQNTVYGLKDIIFKSVLNERQTAGLIK
jgi:hypothetical protein